MGFRDKLLTGAGAVLLGALARTRYRDFQETKRRRNSPLCFDEGLTQSEFKEIARDIAKRTRRVESVVVTGMTVRIRVGSNSGLSTWRAEIDFNDYGHLTGEYWLNTENSQSLIPQHFANAVRAQIKRRVSGTAGVTEPTPPAASEPTPPPGWYPSQGGVRWWDGNRWFGEVQRTPPQQPMQPQRFQPGVSVSYVPVPTNHTLHLILTILTCGAWGLFVWLRSTRACSMSTRKTESVRR